MRDSRVNRGSGHIDILCDRPLSALFGCGCAALRYPLDYFAYNFIQIHRTLRTSPAMAAGVTDHLWSVADLVALWESEERQGERAVA